MVPDMRFSTGSLRIGVSTSALQIEGGDLASNWSDWADRPGRIQDGSYPGRATDHWTRWREDTALMASLGLQVYRMGVEWSRIEPRPGEFDRAALDRYRQELQACAGQRDRPLVTLHHFTNPLWFQELGEWTDPRSVDLFTRFTPGRRRGTGRPGQRVGHHQRAQRVCHPVSPLQGGPAR